MAKIAEFAYKDQEVDISVTVESEEDYLDTVLLYRTRERIIRRSCGAPETVWDNSHQQPPSPGAEAQLSREAERAFREAVKNHTCWRYRSEPTPD